MINFQMASTCFQALFSRYATAQAAHSEHSISRTDSSRHRQLHRDSLVIIFDAAALIFIINGAAALAASAYLIMINHKIYVNSFLELPSGELIASGHWETHPFTKFAAFSGPPSLAVGVLIRSLVNNREIIRRSRRYVSRDFNV